MVVRGVRARSLILLESQRSNANSMMTKTRTPTLEHRYKNKAKGMMSAAASMGMVHQWDIDDGFSALDKFLYVCFLVLVPLTHSLAHSLTFTYRYVDDVNIKAGGVLGIGVCNSGVYNTDIDAAIGVLPEYLERDSAYKRDECT